MTSLFDLLLFLDASLHIFVSKEREENVIEDLDRIDVEQSLRRGYERKVHYVQQFLEVSKNVQFRKQVNK
jgi:hypothetical protein